MHSHEKCVARIIFKNKIYEANGQAFEDIFTKVMNYTDIDFQQIKPWGNIGDRKNDGYNANKGIYYQVYAPEDIEQSYPDLVKKLLTDFQGLISNWTNIKEFYFVVNDKYRGVNPDSEKNLQAIKNTHGLSECRFLTAKDLENKLFELSDDQIYAIAGCIPDPINLKNLDYDILNEIIEHINSKSFTQNKEKIVAPDWDKKIVFNNLTDFENIRLTNGYFQLSSLDDFLHNNGSLVSQELQIRVNSAYAELLKTYNGSELFWEIVNQLSPKALPIYQASVIVIMSKYFESCDIFEEPIE